MNKLRIYKYYINLDERGEFYADIRDPEERTVLEIDTEYAQFLSDERVNVRSLGSMWDYFRTLGDLPGFSILTKGN